MAGFYSLLLAFKLVRQVTLEIQLPIFAIHVTIQPARLVQKLPQIAHHVQIQVTISTSIHADQLAQVESGMMIYPSKLANHAFLHAQLVVPRVYFAQVAIIRLHCL